MYKMRPAKPLQVQARKNSWEGAKWTNPKQRARPCKPGLGGPGRPWEADARDARRVDCDAGEERKFPSWRIPIKGKINVHCIDLAHWGGWRQRCTSRCTGGARRALYVHKLNTGVKADVFLQCLTGFRV